MTLDDVLQSALQGPNVRAIVLFDEFYIPLAGRGTFDKTDIQIIIPPISLTNIGTVGQITLNDGRLAQFHHAETHTVVLIKSTSSSPELIKNPPNAKPGHFENTIGSPSSVSTATAKEHRHSRNLSGGSSSGAIFAPGTSAGLSISTISASVETIKAGASGKATRLSYAEVAAAPPVAPAS